MTTRYRRDDFSESLLATLHEAGHGMYEQGLPGGEAARRPSGQSVSLGVHESQSRFWENHVGRGPAFWSRWLDRTRELFPALGVGTVDEMVDALGACERGLIRVGADEASYDLHIILRFRIEVAMIGGDLEVGDIPAAWKELAADLLGVDVPDDRRGCLQDIHWAMGGIGYFPTYTFGNLLAAQLAETVEADPQTRGALESGDFAALLGWMRERIHQVGSVLPPADLARTVTGREPSPAPLLRHLRRRYTDGN